MSRFDRCAVDSAEKDKPTPDVPAAIWDTEISLGDSDRVHWPSATMIPAGVPAGCANQTMHPSSLSVAIDNFLPISTITPLSTPIRRLANSMIRTVIREELLNTMKAIRIVLIGVLAAIGCAQSTNSERSAAEKPKKDSPRFDLSADPGPLPPQITNQFGMTFRLVKIDTSRADHKHSFPDQSFYMQESRLVEGQHSAFRKAAFGDGKYDSIDWHFNGGYPSEWREWSRYAQALSNFDAEYDYSLPSRSQWTFACMSGYNQSCDETKPNAFGIAGLIDTNRFAEPVDEFMTRDGYEFAVLMGYWTNNWGVHTGKTKPECSCEYWTICNPDADDSLNEMISGRFILRPNGSADATQDGGRVQ